MLFLTNILAEKVIFVQKYVSVKHRFSIFASSINLVNIV